MFRLDFATSKSNSSDRRDWCKQFTVVSCVGNVV